MEDKEFKIEMARLKTQWPHAYGTEREGLIFKAFRSADIVKFRDAVSFLIGNSKSAPLMEDFTREVTRTEGTEFARYSSSGFADASGVLSKAARHTKASPEFVKACLKVVRDRSSGKLTKEQAEQAYEYLDQTAKQINPESCVECGDNGYTFRRDRNGHSLLYRCNCAVGRMRPQTAQGPQNSAGVREVVEILFAPPKPPVPLSGRDKAFKED